MDSSKALRRLIKEASDFGITYSTLANESPDWANWSENTIKQLVVRKGAIRPSRRVAALRDTVMELARNLKLPQSAQDEMEALGKEAQGLSVNFPEPTTNAIDQYSKFIGQCFLDTRKKSVGANVPNRFAFVRYDYESRRLIKIIVDVRKGSEGQVFSMKLTGRQQNRRIVVGDILEFFGVTTFSGLAFNVSQQFKDDDFYNLDVFNFEKFEAAIDKRPLGNEKFDIPTVHLHRPLVPADFIGLDGGGNPISGTGLVVSEAHLEHFGIAEDAFSSVECANDNGSLLKAMELGKAKTLPPDYFVDILSSVLSSENCK